MRILVKVFLQPYFAFVQKNDEIYGSLVAKGTDSFSGLSLKWGSGHSYFLKNISLVLL